jgi:predicted RNase H-like HicB family nuclease
MKKARFTAVIQKRPKGYIGWVEEVPGANSQGMTKKEVVENLKEAVTLALSANRAFANKSTSVLRQTFLTKIPA